MGSAATGRGRHLLAVASALLAGVNGGPAIHRDPFDRMLVCQALEDGIPLVTRDEVIGRYPLQTIW